MKKIIFSIATFLLFNLSVFALDDLTLRDYDGIELPKGTLFQVINLKEFSTAYDDDTTKVSFMSTNDTFMHETNIVPKGTFFFGFIEKMHEPIIGTNASMVIKITKMQLPDGFEIPIRGYIYTNNGNLIGGGMTQPASYVKVPHYQQGLNPGTLQYVPGPTRKMGEHLTITAGADLQIVLTSPAYITHTLTN